MSQYDKYEVMSWIFLATISPSRVKRSSYLAKSVTEVLKLDTESMWKPSCSKKETYQVGFLKVSPTLSN